jgi:uncharacterized protein
MRTRLLILSVATMLLATFAAGKLAAPDLPMPDRYVEDYANVIAPQQEQALDGILQELDQKTGVQYIILTVETTGGLPIEQYAIELAHNKWKLGQKDKDNGLLFVLAVKDRQYRFEVGYGLEGVITDRFAGQVGRDILAPYLRRDDYSTGIYEANLRIIQRIAEDAGVKLTGMPALSAGPPLSNRPRIQRNAPTSLTCPCCGFLILLILFAVLFGSRGGRGGGGGGWWLLALPFLMRGFGGHRHYYGGPFGGGFGGFGGGLGGGGLGGFGGFGGGGGGGFGGGGASGGW